MPCDNVTDSKYENLLFQTPATNHTDYYEYDYKNEGWLSDHLEEMYKILRAAQWTTNIWLTAFLATIFILGLIGNILVLIVFSQRKVKMASSILLMGLAVNDLIICTVVLPGVLLKEWYVPFQHDIMCRGWELVRCATIPLSSLLLMVTAVDRCILICGVGQVKAMTVRHARYCLLMTAVFSLCHGIPPMLRVGVYQAGPSGGTVYFGLCLGNNLLVSKSMIDYYWQAMAAEFLLVLLVVVVMYGLVFRAIYIQNNKWPNGRGASKVGTTRKILSATMAEKHLGDNNAASRDIPRTAFQNAEEHKNTERKLVIEQPLDSNLQKVVTAIEVKNIENSDCSHQNLVPELNELNLLSFCHLTALKEAELMSKSTSCHDKGDSVFTIKEKHASESSTYPLTVDRDVQMPSISSRDLNKLRNKNGVQSQDTKPSQQSEPMEILQMESSEQEQRHAAFHSINKVPQTNFHARSKKYQNKIHCCESSLIKKCSSGDSNHCKDLHNNIACTSESTSVMGLLVIDRLKTTSRVTVKQFSKGQKICWDRRIHPISEIEAQHSKQQEKIREQEHSKEQENITEQEHSKQQGEASPKKRYTKAQVKTAKVLLLVTAVYLLSFAPALLMTLDIIPSHPIPFYGYFIHSAANPLIHSFMAPNFRQQLQKLLPKKRIV